MIDPQLPSSLSEKNTPKIIQPLPQYIPSQIVLAISECRQTHVDTTRPSISQEITKEIDELWKVIHNIFLNIKKELRYYTSNSQTKSNILHILAAQHVPNVIANYFMNVAIMGRALKDSGLSDNTIFEAMLLSSFALTAAFITDQPYDDPQYTVSEIDLSTQYFMDERPNTKMNQRLRTLKDNKGDLIIEIKPIITAYKEKLRKTNHPIRSIAEDYFHQMLTGMNYERQGGFNNIEDYLTKCNGSVGVAAILCAMIIGVFNNDIINLNLDIDELKNILTQINRFFRLLNDLTTYDNEVNDGQQKDTGMSVLIKECNGNKEQAIIRLTDLIRQEELQLQEMIDKIRFKSPLVANMTQSLTEVASSLYRSSGGFNYTSKTDLDNILRAIIR